MAGLVTAAVLAVGLRLLLYRSQAGLAMRASVDDRPLAILCRSGNRSGQVADYLTAAGDHGDVANIEGGIIAWAHAGLPYEGDVPR